MKPPVVKEFMPRNVVTLQPDMDINDAIALLFRKKISGAPVVQDDKQLVGMLSEKDCLRTFLNGAFSSAPGGRVSKFMSGEITTCREDDDLFKVADVFFQHSFRRLPVLKDGVLIGLVSRIHVLQGCVRLFGSDGKGALTDTSSYLTDQLKAALKGGGSTTRRDVRPDSTEHVRK